MKRSLVGNSGQRGNAVSGRQRARAGKKRPTRDQRRARADMRRLSAAWNNLTEEQRRAWNDVARRNRRGGLSARSLRRSGRRLFMKVNFRRLALGLEILAWPPEADSYRPLPLGRFVITNTCDRIALHVHVTGGPVEGVMVSSWHPVNPGVMVWKKFVRIGPLSAPVGGISEITRQYVAKYGVPAVGRKLFIRLQQLNDYMGTLVQVMAAIVPAPTGGRGGAKEA